MSGRSIRDILASLGESVTIEMGEDETPQSVAVIVKTVDGAGRARIRTGGTSDGELLQWAGARKRGSEEKGRSNLRWERPSGPEPSKRVPEDLR